MRLPHPVRHVLVSGLTLLLALVAMPGWSVDVELGSGSTTGAVPLESIGPITFGDEGVLFIADSTSASVFAVDTRDNETRSDLPDLDLRELDRKVGSLLGTTADGIEIHDLATNPASRNLYLSVTRGQGEEARHVVVRVTPNGDLGLLDLDNARFSRAALRDVPPEDATDRRGRPLRREALTDLEYTDGRLLVTGLSNEEFASKLRRFAFPFDGVAGGTSLEIFHGAHGRWETNAPVRTMTLFDVGDEPHVLAAYTCTPLVKIPLSALLSEDGQKIMGSTIAELGNRNRPLDMVVYRKAGREFLLMANTSRGVMKIDLDAIETVDPITERIPDKAGLPYETIADLVGIEQLAPYDDRRAVVLAKSEESVSLRTIALP